MARTAHEGRCVTATGPLSTGATPGAAARHVLGASGALAALGLYALLVFTAAPLLAVPVHTMLVALGAAPAPLHELTADLLKLVALLALWPLLRACRLRGRAAWGLACAAGATARRLLAGLGFGVLSMLVVVAVLLAAGVRVPREAYLELLPMALAKATLTAVLVAMLEELWFRGALHSVLAPLGRRAVVLLVAVLYAALHFLRPDRPVPVAESWYDGFVALAGMFGRMSDAASFDAFVALLLAGLLLGWLRLRDGCIAAAIGCHAGWVLVVQCTRRTTQSVPDASFGWLAGSYDGIIGWTFAGVLLAAGALGWRRAAATALDAPGTGAHP